MLKEFSQLMLSISKMVMKKLGHHDISLVDGMRMFWATPFSGSHNHDKFWNLTNECLTDFCNTVKCSQWLYLFTGSLWGSILQVKCLLLGVWPENWLFGHSSTKLWQILVQEGHWSFSDTTKCSPWPFLYNLHLKLYVMVIDKFER